MWRQKIISRSYIHTRLQSLSLFFLLLFLLCLSTSGCTIPPDVKPRLRHFFWSLLRPERRSVQGRKQKSTKKEEKQRKRRSARTNGKRREVWRACVSQEHRVLSHSPPHAVCSTSLRLSSPLPSRRFATSDSRFLHFLLFFFLTHSPFSFSLSLFYVVCFFFLPYFPCQCWTAAPPQKMQRQQKGAKEEKKKKDAYACLHLTTCNDARLAPLLPLLFTQDKNSTDDGNRRVCFPSISHNFAIRLSRWPSEYMLVWVRVLFTVCVCVCVLYTSQL